MIFLLGLAVTATERRTHGLSILARRSFPVAILVYG